MASLFAGVPLVGDGLQIVVFRRPGGNHNLIHLRASTRAAEKKRQKENGNQHQRPCIAFHKATSAVSENRNLHFSTAGES